MKQKERITERDMKYTRIHEIRGLCPQGGFRAGVKLALSWSCVEFFELLPLSTSS